MTGALPSDFAKFAPAIAERASTDDSVAVELCRLAGAHVDALARRLVALGVDRVCLVRGLASPIEPWLADETRRHRAAPLGDAVDGALQLARNAAQSPLHRGATPSRRQR